MTTVCSTLCRRFCSPNEHIFYFRTIYVGFMNFIEPVLVEIQSIVLKIRFYERFKEFAVPILFPHSKIHSDVRIFGHEGQRIANVQVIEQQPCRIFLPRIEVIVKVLRQPYVQKLSHIQLFFYSYTIATLRSNSAILHANT